jgi:peptidoglycan hydrolase-like protein with peptidoglycan-binding domain
LAASSALGTEAAVINFQKNEGLTPDGVAGPLSQAALGLTSMPAPGPSRQDITGTISVIEVSAAIDDDLAHARKLVNGGTHGLVDFIGAYNVGNRLIG